MPEFEWNAVEGGVKQGSSMGIWIMGSRNTFRSTANWLKCLYNKIGW